MLAIMFYLLATVMVKKSLKIGRIYQRNPWYLNEVHENEPRLAVL